jgi:hypothetical protein
VEFELTISVFEFLKITHIEFVYLHKNSIMSRYLPKMIFSQELEGPRRRRRLRKRWKEEVERDLHVLGVRRWRELETDRKKLWDIVGQAKAHRGL